MLSEEKKEKKKKQAGEDGVERIDLHQLGISQLPLMTDLSM